MRLRRGKIKQHKTYYNYYKNTRCCKQRNHLESTPPINDTYNRFFFSRRTKWKRRGCILLYNESLKPRRGIATQPRASNASTFPTAMVYGHQCIDASYRCIIVNLEGRLISTELTYRRQRESRCQKHLRRPTTDLYHNFLFKAERHRQHLTDSLFQPLSSVRHQGRNLA